MKKIKCYDCEKEFTAETEKEAQDQMHPHYMEAHNDIIKDATEEDKKVWMDKFHKDWEKAEEV